MVIFVDWPIQLRSIYNMSIIHIISEIIKFFLKTNDGNVGIIVILPFTIRTKIKMNVYSL